MIFIEILRVRSSSKWKNFQAWILLGYMAVYQYNVVLYSMTSFSTFFFHFQFLILHVEKWDLILKKQKSWGKSPQTPGLRLENLNDTIPIFIFYPYFDFSLSHLLIFLLTGSCFYTFVCMFTLILVPELFLPFCLWLKYLPILQYSTQI